MTGMRLGDDGTLDTVIVCSGCGLLQPLLRLGLGRCSGGPRLRRSRHGRRLRAGWGYLMRAYQVCIFAIPDGP